MLRRDWYPVFYKLCRLWAYVILIGMGWYWHVQWAEQLDKNKSYVFVANHTSMIDIMLMFVIIKQNPLVFVGKKELAKIPLFGYFYKRTNILVDRSSAKSRQAVFLRAQNRIREGVSICVFPEAGVPHPSVVLDRFKAGAFRMAINHQITLVPMVFFNNKKRFPYAFFSGSPGKLRAKVYPFIDCNGLTSKDTFTICEQVRTKILEDLENYPKTKGL